MNSRTIAAAFVITAFVILFAPHAQTQESAFSLHFNSARLGFPMNTSGNTAK